MSRCSRKDRRQHELPARQGERLVRAFLVLKRWKRARNVSGGGAGREPAVSELLLSRFRGGRSACACCWLASTWSACGRGQGVSLAAALGRAHSQGCKQPRWRARGRGGPLHLLQTRGSTASRAARPFLFSFPSPRAEGEPGIFHGNAQPSASCCFSSPIVWRGALPRRGRRERAEHRGCWLSTRATGAAGGALSTAWGEGC